MTETGGLLLVHAHPDDESITTGGTIAHYRKQGVPVTVVTCTLGEEGEVIGERWAGLVADQANQLGGYRISELTAALDAVGVASPNFLGGAGKWRDSGMAGTPSAANPRAFVNAGDEPIDALTEVILTLKPQVVVTYDPNGGYGHPDHIRAHEITVAALERAAERGFDVPKFYWTVFDRDVLREHVAALVRRTVDELPGALPDGWLLPVDALVDYISTDAATAVIDVSDVVGAKRAALRAHATQVTVAPSGREYALSNNIALPIMPVEHFVLARGKRGATGADGLEHDLFAGLD
ncbi:N-acetyl-1-D-myo-inositol-2-amino-2-deoxy-alpha-D-glucopyranoside deacetylase [Nocardia camponoti]|uniref:1D-myo-inositol 2-acetamido-2-deoxy-alpha-D-glucopyranoside deacetylase n=1 Tax=Nocardia camponoti TaxID=1616106 RepID=A0A917QFQ5_9NOCA|nr:N-acetyl-1-D-myo-inositol-2-amino-2-deoxy-alpha-D-glucopyranoside deacetylase [Nocardia camponoti]GGK47737.1 1D-myo-inositol 2-acetamido-2-deoxy-alpha-D-glucopyranoside deacetylase [Nocardia camponoti]